MRSPLSTCSEFYNFVVADDAAQAEAPDLLVLACLFPDVHLQLLLSIAFAHHHQLKDSAGRQLLPLLLRSSGVALREVGTIIVAGWWGLNRSGGLRHSHHELPVPGGWLLGLIIAGVDGLDSGLH